LKKIASLAHSSRCRRKVCESNYAYSDEEGLTDFSAGSDDDYEPEHDSESSNTGILLYRNSNIVIG
jgi:hypothetical protein